MAAPFKLRSQGSPFKQIGSSPVKQDLGDPSKGKVKTNVPDKKEFIESLGGLKDPNYEKPFSIEDLHQKGGPTEKGTPVKPKSEKRTEQEQPTTPTTPAKPKVKVKKKEKDTTKKTINLDKLTDDEKKLKVKVKELEKIQQKKEDDKPSKYDQMINESQKKLREEKRRESKTLRGRIKRIYGT